MNETMILVHPGSWYQLVAPYQYSVSSKMLGGKFIKDAGIVYVCVTLILFSFDNHGRDDDDDCAAQQYSIC